MSTNDTITREELQASLDRLGYHNNILNASEVFNDVQRHREPVYAVGDLFEDAEGRQWYRCGDRDLPWCHVPTSQYCCEDRPKRPLRKLVPEGSRSASISHGRVFDELKVYTNLPREAAVDLAWRICQLLDGEQ